MYQVIARSILMKLIIGVGVLSAIASIYVVAPTTPQEFLRAASIAVSMAVGVLLVVGFSPIWRLFWWLLPPLNTWVFPNINGEWSVTMESNIGELAKQNPDLKGAKPKSTIPGRLTIKQNWFFVSIVFRGDDRYSNSETIFVKLIRMEESGRFKLAYTYLNHTPKQLPTDESSHLGSAVVEILGDRKSMRMEGVYWTNRNWPKGLNTAGTVEMRQV